MTQCVNVPSHPPTGKGTPLRYEQHSDLEPNGTGFGSALLSEKMRNFVTGIPAEDKEVLGSLVCDSAFMRLMAFPPLQMVTVNAFFLLLKPFKGPVFVSSSSKLLVQGKEAYNAYHYWRFFFNFKIIFYY